PTMATQTPMEVLQKEHERLLKRLKGAQSLKHVQSTIDLLQSARDTIAADPGQTVISMAKLQNPIKSSFDSMNDNLKEVHSGLNKYTKALDKVFKDRPLPSTNDHDALSEQDTLINRAIGMHLLREGQFSVAASFLSEISERKALQVDPETSTTEPMASSPDSANNLLDEVPSSQIRKEFASMYYILHEMKENNNLLPAIEWSRENREALEARGSNLEFELCRLQFVWVFHGKSHDQSIRNREDAIAYARREFQGFVPRYLREVQQLIGAMAFCPNLRGSPYASIFNNISAWDDVAQFFTREFCSLLGLSADSPLYVATTAGAIALPTLLKLQTIMKAKRTEWTSENELPVEISLPPSYLFHSIFVCPVSKEQATDENPPMMMPCGHVIAEESLRRLSKGNRFKCPYCPSESHPRDARKIFL
ncbi:regulator of gluconeogenesis Rmd5, partial [Penicillium malachiteum]|uniref:regulator of gluconeogenesis Rmd5 n=1 Tax=Penicillium malachiteum TaxID=1324776 RepID=UPI0025467638